MKIAARCFVRANHGAEVVLRSLTNFLTIEYGNYSMSSANCKLSGTTF